MLTLRLLFYYLIDVLSVAPRLTISPQSITTRAGENIELRCTASGSGPFDIKWSRVDAQINPSTTERDGVLEIRQVTADDAGRYKCVVRSSTAGSSEGFALVVVEVPPSIAVAQRSVYTDENRDVELSCYASGSPPLVVSWEKDGDQLPAQHIIEDGVLTIYGVREADAGRYICTVSSSSGSSSDYAVLNVNSQKSLCPPPFFNFGATVTGDCVRCFCFGQSVQCFSSDLQVSKIALSNTLQFMRRDSDGTRTPVDETLVNYLQRTDEYQVRDMTRVLQQGKYYWSMPREFLGERLTSYGGELKYTIFCDIQCRTSATTSDVDVIIGGNGMELYYRARSVPSVGVPTSISVPLIESSWERSDGTRRRGDTPVDSQYAIREDFMTVLQNVEYILIRGIYDRDQSTSRIGGLFLTTAVDYPTEYGQAYLVEKCECPTGYTGLSCQNCAPGFSRDTRGGYLGQCVSCNCNGHSNDCDRAPGQCLNCQHNTEGPQCQLCAAGYYGDAKQGTPNDCQPCPCPLSVPSNQFSRSCNLASDNEVTCANCPVGFEGRRCERCTEGYTGDPMTFGSTCQKGLDDNHCDPRGSLTATPNPLTGRCSCKENVYGDKCDTCKTASFYLSNLYQLGCVRCFCMGVSTLCHNTSWSRVQVGVPLNGDNSGVKLTDSNGNALRDQRLTFGSGRRELVYRTRDANEDMLYWTLPSVFLGDKVTAYGGSFRFTVRYTARQGVAVSNAEPLVKLSGNDINLIYRSRLEMQPDRQESVNIIMYEQNWYRSDGQPATREHLLTALADLDSILIRATFERPQLETAIRDITLDIAENRQTRQDRAYAVESCQCPAGYRGLSCEDCDTGYTRSGGGLYLGLCEPCNCNGHSKECDPETGVCRNCQHNTEGDYCELCAVGYYGDSTSGRRDACQKCPCPLTEALNQFSPRCRLDTDNLVTCEACPVGYTGRYCDTCTAGYSGNPRQLGDYCKIEPTFNCNCDARGIVPNTQCNESTLQCQCKPYVQGLQCARCREGYFYLESNNPQGCLTCFCSGITNQCSSSKYYRDSLRPQLGSDDSHNFVLMNRRMNNIISDGFVVDSARNQITYNRFEGVQQGRESLFFQLPPKFRGDRVSSYGGYLRFKLEFSAIPSGRMYRDVDFEIISSGRSLRLYYLFEPSLQEGKTQTYEILLRENSFNDLRSNSAPTRETFMTILSNIEGILIRATYHENMASVTLRDVTMDTAVATPTNLGGSPMVEICQCPEGYIGLSCQRCAQGYLRVSDGRGGLGRCVRCNCNGHATSCDPDTGRCLECQHNTEGDRCERCLTGYYGDATSGTPNDCRACPCPLTTSPNQFSPSCYLAEDSRVTCDRCPTGYTGRQCQTCAEGYIGEPSRPGGSCRLSEEDRRPAVNVLPLRVEEPEGSTAVFQCQVNGDGPFNVVWSRLDRRPLPDRTTTSPNHALTLRNLVRGDSAKYICTATNRYGVTSRDVELKVIYGQTPLQVRIDRTRIEIEEGRTVIFVCTITGTTGDMTYILSWSRQNGRMPSKAIDQNGVLVIPNIQRSDAGNYECTGLDMFTVDSEVAVLIVSGSTDEQAPSVRIEPRYQEVDEGTSVRFQCVATGEPKPRVEWYRVGDREMNPNAVITADGEFRIPRVTTDDESDYFCRATNDIGTAERRTILYVKKVDRPSITIIVRQTKYVTVAGDTARLECYVEDTTGRVTLFWSRPTGLPTGSSQDRGILTIPNVQPSYAGNYVCTGTDSELGRVSTAVAVLEVTVDATEPPKVRLEPEKITIPMGTTGTLRCQVTGSPAPVVTWLKSREELSANHQVNGNVLRITQATMADRGIYVCRAENSAGIDQDWTVVEVEKLMRPKVDIYPNTTQVVAVGGSALFQCRVMDGDPPPTVQWTRVGGLPLPEGKVEIMENGVIMFKQVTQSEQGGYICTAENDMGSTSSTATLIVEGPPSIIIQPSKTVYALIGQRVTLECTADGDPTPGVYWVEPPRRQRGEVLLETPEQSPLSSGNAVLDIASVQRENEGTYTCVARNTGGETRDRVQLIIREGDRAGVTISGPSTLSVVDGQSVELVCSANQLRNPLIRWRRREGSLPPGHSVRQGVLSLPRFRAEYAGEYICTTSIQQQTYEASVFIIVTVAPRLTISPQRISTRAGDTIQLRCTASGSGPFDIEWSRVDAQINPNATERDGVLEIRQVTAADAGRYRCVVRSSTAGSREGFVLVVVEVPPSIAVAQRSVYTDENRNVELRCDASGSPPPVVSWEKEGGQLPAQHRIRDGILTIYGVRDADAGRYICTASSSSGSSKDYAVLNVNTGSTIDNSGANLESQIVNVGDRVSLECIVTGTPLPTITWSRDDGPLPDDAVLGDGILIIPRAKIEDAGTYTCLAVNEAGSFRSKIVLYVKAQPSLSAPSTASAALGDRATLVCDAGGFPSPDITWYRKDGSMPSDYTIVDGDLVFSRVRQEDAGTYVCHAENQHGQTDTPVSLNVGALVPRFVQDPNSYMAYSPLSDVYLDFDILLSIKPESTEGMVLYNGQFEDGGGDFVCFGLNEGYPEFRFDVGSGPAIIRGNKTLGLNEWHTIQLTRNKKKGSMVVNEQPGYTGESPGYFTGLDLEGKMYLGSVPNYDQIPRVAGFKEGFVGSISEVKIKGIDLNLGEEALDIVGVEPYNGCRNQPCGNGGTCVSANTRYGFQCVCAQGYTGSRCQEVGERCYPGACGGRGRCYNLDSGYGFRCICPIGKTGTGCQADVPINYPFFNRTSFISYPAAEDTLFALTIKLEYKPQSLSDGIILYEGNDKDGTGDFMALVQKDGYLEFRFDTRSGPAIFRSRTSLRVDDWTHVMATRKNREGTLVVNDDEPVTATLPPISVDVSPRNLKIREGAEALITCMAQGLPAGARVEWFRGTEGLPMQSAVEGKLMIPVAKTMDSGVYTCRVVGIPGNFQSSARLEVFAYGPIPNPPDPDGSCGQDEAVCQNGQCIRREYRCDGENDCADGSDELADCFANLCEPNEHRCPSGQCIKKIWRCDGESDCDDGSDERNCEAKAPEDACAPDEFKCVSGDQCVPLAYQCDQEIDCLDKSDEIGCSKPVIIVPPVAEIEVELGGTFTIICEAVGVPTPLIVWRLNWGNIPTGERITVVSQNGRGQLTVTNAVYEDAGAYTCEAVNNRGSIFAIPDALVIVRRTSPGSTVGLNLKLPLFLGGSDPTIPVSTSTGVNRGFIGCVAELTVNDRKYDLLNDAIESVNIVDCGEIYLCQRLPCRNKGVCEDLPGPDYRCLCPASHTGKFCEVEINICLTNSPCQNGASCSITNEGYRCDCPLGFAGDNCQRAIVLDTQFKFEGDGFLELTKDLLPHAKSQERQTMAFSIRTTQSDGLIMWQGEVGGRPLRGGDHVALGLKGGYVEFSYEMGSGPATILSNQRVDDGRVHLIAVQRLARTGTLTVDNNESVYGESLGYLQMLNVYGNIYIGGVSAAEIMTDGKYTDNFIGCIDSINIHGKGPLESRDAISGFNVQPCSP